MASYLAWLQNLRFSVWIAESDSLFGYPLVLFLHSVGMGLSAGTAFVIGLRLVGIAHPLPVSSLRVLFKFFWAGFYLNALTGSILFAARATTMGYVPMYYAKLALIAAGVLLSMPIRKFADSGSGDVPIPGRIKALAALSLVTWIGVITTGRLIAYFS